MTTGKGKARTSDAGSWARVVERFIAALPFHKITGPQAFDLACDVVAGAFAFAVAFFVPFEPEVRWTKPWLIVAVFAFFVWSARINQK